MRFAKSTNPIIRDISDKLRAPSTEGVFLWKERNNMRRILILLLIGCLAVTVGELTKLWLKQHKADSIETEMLRRSCEFVLIIN